MERRAVGQARNRWPRRRFRAAYQSRAAKPLSGEVLGRVSRVLCGEDETLALDEVVVHRGEQRVGELDVIGGHRATGRRYRDVRSSQGDRQDWRLVRVDVAASRRVRARVQAQMRRGPQPVSAEPAHAATAGVARRAGPAGRIVAARRENATRPLAFT